MFFEYNNSIHDSVKLERKRILHKNFLFKELEDSINQSKINNSLFFDEDTLQVIEIKILNVEEYVVNNFSF